MLVMTVNDTVDVSYNIIYATSMKKESLYCTRLRPRVSLEPPCDHFVLPIPTCWYWQTPMDPTQTPLDPTHNPTDPMRTEYSLRWVRKGFLVEYQLNSCLHSQPQIRRQFKMFGSPVHREVSGVFTRNLPYQLFYNFISTNLVSNI